MTVKNYLSDGASYQARAVLMFLQPFLNIEDSWNKERNQYEADVQVARWENCREQGYVLTLRNKDYSRQLNIAFFEHRNSDSICAIKWEQSTTNSPTIDTAEFGDVYKDKYDTSFDVRYGEIQQMSQWIIKQFEEFWEETSQVEAEATD